MNTTPEARRYHLHFDAERVHPDLANEIIKIGFWPDNFSGHPDTDGMEPETHLTWKGNTRDEYIFRRNLLYALVKEAPESQFKGYLEGEAIMEDIDLPEIPYSTDQKPGFRIHNRKVSSDRKEHELHIALDEASHPELLQALRDLGLFYSRLQKEGYIACIYTAAGSKELIGELFPLVQNYLLRVGGAKYCSIKKEAIAFWYEALPEDECASHLMPVVDRIERV